MLHIYKSQQKHSNQLLQQALADIETRKIKNKTLKRQHEETKESLAKTEESLK